MTDSMGPGKLVRHMQNPSYTYAGLNIDGCPGQVEFLNYSWRASENFIMLAPLGKYTTVYTFGLLLRMCASFVVSGIQACPRKYAFTCQHHVLLSFKWNIIKHTIFQGQVKIGVGQVKVESHLPHWDQAYRQSYAKNLSYSGPSYPSSPVLYSLWWRAGHARCRLFSISMMRSQGNENQSGFFYRLHYRETCAQSTTFGLFVEASLFRLTGWFHIHLFLFIY